MTCPTCHQDTDRDADGTCLWCHPRFNPDAYDAHLRACPWCKTTFEPTPAKKKFCSERCQKSAWRITDAGRSSERARCRRRRASA